MSGAPRLSVVAIEAFERDVRLRLPFRFGVVTLTEAPQAFVGARVRLEDGREAWGAAAELLVPKWFDKNPALSNEQNFDQLRTAVALAAAAYTGDATPRTAFGHYAAHYRSQIEAGAARGLNPLVASFGPALVDRAVLDGLCRALGMSFYEAIRRNAAGIEARVLAPELIFFDMAGFLARLAPRERIAIRHTVGLLDPVAAADAKTRVHDGLPETLEEIVARYGHRHFKLKVGGDLAADVDRLARVAAVIDRSPAPYFATLDGNEQYADVDGVLALWRAVLAEPRLARLAASTLFIEQPIARANAFARDVSALAALKPVLIDESDGELDAFPRARGLGYTGVSSKVCKGFYKSLLNAARCVHWNAAEPGRYFMSGEDLTCQAGLAVQQDLALVNLLGLGHVERNGHHYVKGMAGASPAEQAAFLAAHGDLYEDRGGTAQLRITGGHADIGSLACTGFASGAMPDFSTMRPMRTGSAPASTGAE